MPKSEDVTPLRHEHPPKSINQLIAYNMRRARKLRGVSQEQLGASLEGLTDHKWSAAAVSAAERSYESGRRPRRFDASEIAALAQIFGLPISYFFIPPDDLTEWPAKDIYTTADPSQDNGWIPRGMYIELIEPVDVPIEFATRIRDLLAEKRVRWEPSVREHVIPFPPEWRERAEQLIGRPLSDEGGTLSASELMRLIRALARNVDQDAAWGTDPLHRMLSFALDESARAGVPLPIRSRVINDLSDLDKPWPADDDDG